MGTYLGGIKHQASTSQRIQRCQDHASRGRVQRIPIISTSNTVSSAENALDAQDNLEGSGIMELVAMGYGREVGTRMFFDVSVASSGTAALFNASPSSNANLDFEVTCRRRERLKEVHNGPGLQHRSTPPEKEHSASAP